MIYSFERATGIGPVYEAWEASILPLNYARKISLTKLLPAKGGSACLPSAWPPAEITPAIYCPLI